MAAERRPGRHLRTSDVARAVGVHPNTVRLYEAWGFLPAVPRSPSGYRLFSEDHVEVMRLARTALHWPYPGGKEPVLALVRYAVAGDLGAALEEAYRYLAQVRAERAEAEGAADYLDRWARGSAVEAMAERLTIGSAARRLGLTVDTLRSWERNGLLRVPRDPQTGYRLYGAEEIGRLRVIRLLRSAGYSTSAVLRMFLQLEGGGDADVRRALDEPRPDEDAYTAADRWLSALQAQEERALTVISLLQEMMAKRRQAASPGAQPSSC